MKNIKKFGEINEADKILPRNGTEIRFVADITDLDTKKTLKQIWEYWNEAQQIKALEAMGHSTKYAGMNYEDLTGEIQSKIVSIEAPLPEKPIRGVHRK